MRPLSVLILLFGLSASQSGVAGEVSIIDVILEKHRDSWTVKTQLKHADTGWEHYADAWRIVDEDGKVIGTRILHHPHVDEQPFRRSLGGVVIPRQTRVVYVEAHDSVHGWSKQRVRVDLNLKEGPRYRIRF